MEKLELRKSPSKKILELFRNAVYWKTPRTIEELCEESEKILINEGLFPRIALFEITKTLAFMEEQRVLAIRYHSGPLKITDNFFIGLYETEMPPSSIFIARDCWGRRLTYLSTQ